MADVRQRLSLAGGWARLVTTPQSSEGDGRGSGDGVQQQRRAVDEGSEGPEGGLGAGRVEGFADGRGCGMV